jgi:hypothetical protein
VSIKFVCSCGKRLKARDEMARRRSICPRCGSLVGIPGSLPDEAVPLTRKTQHSTLSADSLPDRAVPRPGDERVLGILKARHAPRRPKSERHLEDYWYECLSYPLRAWPLCLIVSVVLTLMTAGLAVYLPRVIADAPDDAWTLLMVRASWGLILVMIVGVPCSYLDCILASAVRGDVGALPLSGGLLVAIVRSGLRWLACFCAGPVVFATAAFLYWLQCGDPGVLDLLIITQLGIVALAYQTYALLATLDRGRLRDLNPLAVVDMAHRLGHSCLVTVLAAGGVLMVHAWLLTVGVAEVHQSPGIGCAILAAVWLSGVFCSTFVCRWLGVCCHRWRRALRTVAPVA